MTNELNDDRLNIDINLTASERYTYFLTRVSESQELWTLKSADGYAVYSSDDNKEILPLWPHPQYAEAAKKEEWKYCSAHSIHLNDFLLKWLRGMKQDGRMADIFPTLQEKGIIVSASALELDLKNTLRKRQ